MSLTILLIDDDEFLRKSTKEILISCGYDVVLAHDGTYGVEVAKKIRPDLILCDVEMPAMNGFDVYKKLSEDIRFIQTPFIFLSGKNTIEDIRKGMGLGADDYVTKPFKKKDLIEAIGIRCQKSDRLKAFYEYQDQGLATAIKHGDGLEKLFGITKDFKSDIYPKKSKIYDFGDQSSFLYFISSGQVKISKENNEGKELSVYVLGEGSFFGHQSVLDNTTQKESVSTLVPCEIIKIPKDNFLRLLRSDKTVSLSFIQFLNRQLERNENRLVSMAFDSVRKRTADVLIGLHKEKNNKDQINLSRDDLAALVGTAKETVIRCLSDFKKDGAIEIEGRGISVLSLDKLKKDHF